MAIGFIEDTTLNALGEAIRGKTGSTEKILPSDMPEAIASIKTGADTSKITDWMQFFLNNRRAEIVHEVDMSAALNCQNAFQNSTAVTEIYQPNTSKCLSFMNVCYGCTNLVTATFDMSGATNSANNAFYNCTSLKEVHLNSTKNIPVMAGMFRNCSVLETITGLDFSNTTSTGNTSNIFVGASKLRNCVIAGKFKLYGNFIMNESNDLTVETMMSFINAFEDNTGGNTYTVTFGSTNLARLTAEQKAVAQNKNILLA